MLAIRPMQENEKPEWDRIVSLSPAGTIYHTSEWLDILEENLHIRIARLVASVAGRVVGVFPARFCHPWFAGTAISPPVRTNIPYGGPVTLSTETDAISEFIEAARKRCSRLEITLPPAFGSDHRYAALQRYRQTIQSKRTIAVSLRLSQDEIWRRFRRETRRYIERASKEGIEVREGKGEKSVEVLYTMLERTHLEQAVPLLPRSVFSDIMLRLVPKGKARLLFAEKDGRYLSGYFFLISNNTIGCWVCASDKEDESFRRLSPGRTVIWEAMKWAKKEGIEVFDMVGANMPNMAYFKSSFGGELVSYPFIKWVSKIRSVGATAYRLIRKDASSAERLQFERRWGPQSN